MAICPFCKGPVKEDLLRFGGNCPSCLILIPGEEAATDPGEERRAAEDDAQRKQASTRVRRQRLGIGGIAGLVVAAVAIAILTREPPPTPLILNVGEFYISPMDASRTAALPANVADAAGTAGASNGKPAVRGSQDGGTSSSVAGARVEANAVAPPEDGVATTTSGTAPSSGDPFAVNLGSPRARNANVTLRDDGEIGKMVVDVVNAGQAQLKSCYEARLKNNPQLRGAWAISWVVTKDGRAKDVVVNSRDRSDSEFEGCMGRAVASWRFQPIYEAMSIPPFSFKFGSSG